MKTINDSFEEKIINKCEPATRGERNAIRAYRFGDWTEDGILIVDDLDFAQYVGDMMDTFMTAGIDELIITESSTALTTKRYDCLSMPHAPDFPLKMSRQESRHIHHLLLLPQKVWFPTNRLEMHGFLSSSSK